MNVRRRKLVSLLIFGLILSLPIGAVFGETDDFGDFEGSTHSPGCHGSILPESTNGSVYMTSSSGVNVTPGENFVISLQVVNFSEGASEDVEMGFASGRGDNTVFTYNDTQMNAVLDENGTSPTKWVAVTAPGLASLGSYTLVADAIEGATGGSEHTINWATGTLNINVVALVTTAAMLQTPTSDQLQVTLSWTAVANATIYYIYRNTSAVTDISGLTPIGQTTNTQYEDTVPSEGNYYYAILAGNYWGNGILSNSLNVTATESGLGAPMLEVLIIASAILGVAVVIALVLYMKRK